MPNLSMFQQDVPGWGWAPKYARADTTCFQLGAGEGEARGGEKEDSLISPECPLEDGRPATWLPRKAKVEKDYQVCDQAS